MRADPMRPERPPDAPGAPLAGAVVVVLVAAAMFTTSTALLIAQLARASGEGRTPRPGVLAGDQDVDQRRWKDADWQLDCVASRLPAGGLPSSTSTPARSSRPATVRVQAADTRHAEVYARYGLRPLPTKPLRLVTGG